MTTEIENSKTYSHVLLYDRGDISDRLRKEECLGEKMAIHMEKRLN